jgi:RNA polymerase sigma factor (sigma-70 family)
MHEPSDYELLQGCRRGDAQAWNRLLDQYERLVFSIPLNYGLTMQDAADITQLTFTIFLESVDDLADDSNLSAWLATVARRHTWRLLKDRRRESVGTAGDLSDAMFLLPDPRGGRALQRWEAVEWLNQGLNALDERCRELLLALYFAPEKLTYEEVAERLDMAVGSVGPTRARCLQRLKERLEETTL